MSQTNNPKARSFLAKLKDSGRESSSESSGSPGKLVSDKRREQIRRAQKTHRQRRAEHLNKLEAEVEDLRDRDAQQSSRIQILEESIAELRSLLDLHGIQYELPEALQRIGVERVQARVEVETDSVSGVQTLHCSLPGSGHASDIHDHAAVDPRDAQLGVDFVLALEQPCLYHHHERSEDDPISHSMMMQAPIMARAPSLQDVAKRPSGFGFKAAGTKELPRGSSWNVPGAELERLLFFSKQFTLQGELTPVQAWSLVRDRARNGSITRERLAEFLQLLKAMVSCYGFGAVLEETSFHELLEQYIPS